MLKCLFNPAIFGGDQLVFKTSCNCRSLLLPLPVWCGSPPRQTWVICLLLSRLLSKYHNDKYNYAGWPNNCVLVFDTYSPLWLVPRNFADAYTGAWVASGAQYRRNGVWLLAWDSIKVRASCCWWKRRLQCISALFYGKNIFISHLMAMRTIALTSVYNCVKLDSPVFLFIMNCW